MVRERVADKIEVIQFDPYSKLWSFVELFSTSKQI